MGRPELRIVHERPAAIRTTACDSMRGVAGRRLTDDDAEASRFKALALPYIDEAYTLARYLLRNDTEAEDAVQDCYLRALQYFDGYRGGDVKPWLFAILRNVCRATYTRSKGLVYASDDEQYTGPPGGQVAPLWSDEGDSPERTLLRRHDTETMQRLIMSLPEPFREVIVLREINDLSYSEIATVIAAPIGTVMSRLARARRVLRDAWIATEDGDIPDAV